MKIKIITSVFLLLASAATASAAELKAATLTAFDRYVRLSEARMDQELASGHFLHIDQLPPERRFEVQRRLAAGEVVIERLTTRENGSKITIPDGLVHDWIATAFIPGTTLRDTVALVQDYDHHVRYYAPEVVKSRLLARNGDDFTISLRLKRTKVVTVVLDTEHQVHYVRLDADHVWSRSHSRRIAEVENPGSKDEHDLTPGDDHGFLWRLNSYWRFEQKDGGVYIECEAISLTRDVPTGLGWLVGPFIEKIPRESLTFTMEATRRAAKSQRPVGSIAPPAEEHISGDHNHVR
jgi:hypothetical protein